MDNDKKVILEEELKKGWEAATQLRSLIPSQSQLTMNGRSLSNHDDDQFNFNDQTNMASMHNHTFTILSSLELLYPSSMIWFDPSTFKLHLLRKLLLRIGTYC